jgi:hypothetical protein
MNYTRKQREQWHEPCDAKSVSFSVHLIVLINIEQKKSRKKKLY